MLWPIKGSGEVLSKVKDIGYQATSLSRNLVRSGICLGHIGILIWPRQIPDLPKVSLSQIRIPIWLGRFRICLGQM